MSKSEIQLFLLWNNSRFKEKEIIQELSQNFEIIEIYEIEWNKKLFKLNLERFYCEKIRSKIKHTGTGPFLLVLLRDKNPEYSYMQTLKGYEYVNSKILTLKKKFRKLVGGYKVHSTNDISEVDSNLMFLLNKSYQEYFDHSKEKVWNLDSDYIKIKKEPVGTYGWKNLEEIFHFLNSSCSYVVLRGIDCSGGDIDLLVDDFNKVKYLLNAKKVHKNKFRTQVSTIVAGKECLFDLMYVSDNYYCESWESDILNRRVLSPKGYFVPSDVDIFYSIFYHVYFHKKVPSRKYDDLLLELYKKLFGKDSLVQDNMYDIYLKLLYEYFHKNDYFPIKPKDRKVKYNPLREQQMFWIKTLEKYGFEKIESFYVNKAPASGFNCFFTAYYNLEKVFIKCGQNATSVKKEFQATEYLYLQNQQYFSKPIMYKILADNKMFFASTFVEGKKLSDVDIFSLDSIKLNLIFDSLVTIADILFTNKFIHRDLNGDNLLVQNDGTVKLIDMQHIIGNKFKELEEILANPKSIRGTNKRLRPYPFVFDDMYSVYNILLKFPVENIVDFDIKLSIIKSRIGKLRNYFFDNTFPISSYFKFKLLVFYKIFNSVLKPFRKLFRKK